MKKKKYVLFDLDGTLTDSAQGIINCVEYSLNCLGIKAGERETLKRFIGPPLKQSFRDFYNLDEITTGKAVEFYRERYTEKGIYENSLYEGVEEMLAAIKSEGKELIVATSKPTVFAKQVLSYFHIDNLFTHIVGSELNGERSNKIEVIEYALNLAKIKDKRSAVMVGDREHDIEGARKNDINSIGVLYGYGDITELIKAGADYIAKNVNEIAELLFINNRYNR